MALEAIIASISATGVGILGYFVKKVDTRIKDVEVCSMKNKIALEKKLDRGDAKDLIHDKLDPIHIMLQSIKEDITEIKQDLKSR